MSIIQLTRMLAVCPEVCPPAGIRLRNYEGPQDIDMWLEVRRAAFAREKLGVGQWLAEDFTREFLAKPWWRPEAMWFAETPDPMGMPVGTVTLAQRGDGPEAKPVVHWLAVVPTYRRRGIGRLLMNAVEAAAWERGHRRLWLETHAAWERAAEFYQALGYSRVT